jgi:site-specific DNA recombinase
MSAAGSLKAPRAVGYVRLSTEDQVREGVSLDAQESRIRAYCEAKGWLLVGVVRDEGKSAKDLKRPGLQEILAELSRRRRRWDALVVVKLDRLSRSVKDLAGLTEAFQRAKVGFTSIAENVDTTSASGELFLNIIGALSQWERKAIGERTKAAMTHLRVSGRRCSRWAPYGLRLAAGGRLTPDRKEQVVLEEISRLRRRGLPLRAISATLARRGILARSGRPFTAWTLSKLVSKGPLGDSLRLAGA